MFRYFNAENNSLKRLFNKCDQDTLLILLLINIIWKTNVNLYYA